MESTVPGQRTSAVPARTGIPSQRGGVAQEMMGMGGQSGGIDGRRSVYPFACPPWMLSGEERGRSVRRDSQMMGPSRTRRSRDHSTGKGSPISRFQGETCMEGATRERHSLGEGGPLELISSIHHVVKRMKKDEEIVPAGWTEWRQLLAQGLTAWEAAGLPMKMGSMQPEWYSELRKYDGRLSPIRWATYWDYFQQFCIQLSLSPLQIGVLLGYAVTGKISILISNHLGPIHKYNIYKSLRLLMSWGSTPDEVGKKCKRAFHLRTQAKGETLADYAYNLSYLAEL